MYGEFQSPLKDEFVAYIEFEKRRLKDVTDYRCDLLGLDAFLVLEGLNEKVINDDQVMRWLDSLDVRPVTKKSKLCCVRNFSKYLNALGIPASVPELPRTPASDYVPYVFTYEEMERIFEYADDLVTLRPKSFIAAEFPILLRILYGCGLRVGEALSLTWDDVDLDSGVVTVRIAKNKKQRLVPMSGELTRILCLYRNAKCFSMEEHDCLFKMAAGKPRPVNSYRPFFEKMLCDLGIRGPLLPKAQSFGPCLHGLRHTFVLHSFLQAEAQGRTFMETVPFLSTYLGHEGLMETDKYLKARYEVYRESHTTIEEYVGDVFPEVVFDD